MTAVQVPFLCTAEFMALHRPARERWSYIEVYPSETLVWLGVVLDWTEHYYI